MLKLSSTIHPSWCTIVLGTPTLSQLKVFLYLQKKVYYSTPWTIKCPHFSRLTWYENLFIGAGQEKSVRCPQLTGVRIKRVEFRDNDRGFLQGQRKLSVITKCPYKAGIRKAGFDCILQLSVLFPVFSFPVARARSSNPFWYHPQNSRFFNDFTSRLFPHL